MGGGGGGGEEVEGGGGGGLTKVSINHDFSRQRRAEAGNQTNVVRLAALRLTAGPNRRTVQPTLPPVHFTNEGFTVWEHPRL